MTLDELVGQKLVLGISEARVTPETIALFRKTHAGGLILFKRNFESAEGLRKLISDLETALGRRLLVMVDHEGGRVFHFREGATVFPDAQALGVSGRVDWARKQGEIEGEELRRLGVDLNLAPVLDVLSKAWNPAIGTRSYGKDPETVGLLGRARIEGMQSKGLSACAKHYPGLGEAELDPHTELPVIRKSLKVLKQTHLPPFLKAFEAKVDCVMSSHPVYSEVESDSRRPATFSRKIIHDLLRLELGFQGVALTDDLKMGAVSKTVSLREAAPLAAKAGHDLLLVCSDPKAQEEAFDSLVWAYKKKDLSSKELEESVERIERLKEKRKERFSEGTPLPARDGKELARQIARRGAEALCDGRGLLPLSPAWCLKHSVLAIFPDLSGVARERFVEPELLTPHDFLRRLFSQFGATLGKVEMIPTDPDEKERLRVKELARGEDLIFLFLWDAHAARGARELLKLLQNSLERLVVFLLREPSDFEWIEPKSACITAYGYRTCQIEAAVEKLFSAA